MLTKRRKIASLAEEERTKYVPMIDWIGSNAHQSLFHFSDEVFEQFLKFKDVHAVDVERERLQYSRSWRYSYTNKDHKKEFVPLPLMFKVPTEEIYCKGVRAHRAIYEAVEEFIRNNRSKNLAEFLVAYARLFTLAANQMDWDAKPIFSLFALNEFMSDEGKNYENYGSFVEANYDRLVELMDEFKLVDYDHTEALVERVKPKYKSSSSIDFSPFTLVSNSSKEQKEIVNSLTVEDLNKFIELDIDSIGAYGRSPKGLLVGAKQLIEMAKNSVAPNPSVSDVRHSFTITFFASYVNTPLDSLPKSPNVFIRCTLDEINRIRMSTAAPTNSVISTSRINRISSFLNKHSDEFSPQELFAIFHMLGSKSSVVRAGTVNEFVVFLEEYLNHEHAVDFFKILADVVLNYNQALPTIKEWNESFSEGITNLGGDIAASMAVSTKAYETPRRILEPLRAVRQTLLLKDPC